MFFLRLEKKEHRQQNEEETEGNQRSLHRRALRIQGWLELDIQT